MGIERVTSPDPASIVNELNGGILRSLERVIYEDFTGMVNEPLKKMLQVI